MAEKLDRLYPGWRDQPQLFERYWDKLCKTIETLQTENATMATQIAALQQYNVDHP